jgi:hypothetical protein
MEVGATCLVMALSPTAHPVEEVDPRPVEILTVNGPKMNVRAAVVNARMNQW